MSIDEDSRNNQDTNSQAGLEEYEHLIGAENPHDAPTTTRRELWSYYLYYNGKLGSSVTPSLSVLTRRLGDNGVGPISYTPAL
jgi:hypothetical protein